MNKRSTQNFLVAFILFSQKYSHLKLEILKFHSWQTLFNFRVQRSGMQEKLRRIKFGACLVAGRLQLGSQSGRSRSGIPYKMIEPDKEFGGSVEITSSNSSFRLSETLPWRRRAIPVIAIAVTRSIDPNFLVLRLVVHISACGDSRRGRADSLSSSGPSFQPHHCDIIMRCRSQGSNLDVHCLI